MKKINKRTMYEYIKHDFIKDMTLVCCYILKVNME